ncbi:MAG: hypothetical protein SFU86_25425 [Pirellulaceae bacterium]|nr:hypothetical protein [Pirellulaceae bacterium]
MMIHYSCDRCKRTIDPDQALRYVVRIEVEAVMDSPQSGEMNDDRDHLLEIDEILERVDASQCPEISEDIYQQRRYDLCPQCARKFMQNPVGREKKPAPVGFNPN